MGLLGSAFNKLGQIYRESDWMKEVFGVGVDDTTGLPLAMGTAESTFLGLSVGTWSFVALMIILISLIVTWVAVMT